MSSNRVMQGELPKLLLALITVALGSVAAESACERGQSWWDRSRGACIPCTRCNHTQHLVVKYPCELHRDTICQSLTEVRIRPYSTTIDNKDDSSTDYEYYEDVYSEVPVGSEVKWDLHTSTLTLAASGCIVFFIVVLFFSLSHAKQWKVLKKALTSDVQELSAKLKLMEAGGDAPEPLVGPDHHIYSNIQVTKEALLGAAGSKKGLGNVYTQEKHTP